ncbi:competence type IV pilus minor pilin ComGD [Priestia koreensis]|uniref:competence type IV pilus minor pilin ComGD n=1 Tax=Priestia koreensis TaxID=284581 RepID=UPI00345941EC
MTELFSKVAASNQKGFTLLEMLLVLMVLQVMVGVLLLSVKPVMQTYRLHYFFKQLQTDMWYAQQVAINSEKSVALVFLNAESKYLMVSGGNLIMTRDYEKDVTLQTEVIQGRVSFLQDGNVDRSGTIIVKHYEKKYRVVVLIGRGRFYVQKL